MRRLHDSAAGTEKKKGVRAGVREAEEKGARAGVRGAEEKGAGAGVRGRGEGGWSRGHVELTVSGTGFQVKFSKPLWGRRALNET